VTVFGTFDAKPLPDASNPAYPLTASFADVTSCPACGAEAERCVSIRRCDMMPNARKVGVIPCGDLREISNRNRGPNQQM